MRFDSLFVKVRPNTTRQGCTTRLWNPKTPFSNWPFTTDTFISCRTTWWAPKCAQITPPNQIIDTCLYISRRIYGLFAGTPFIQTLLPTSEDRTVNAASRQARPDRGRARVQHAPRHAMQHEVCPRIYIYIYIHTHIILPYWMMSRPKLAFSPLDDPSVVGARSGPVLCYTIL